VSSVICPYLLLSAVLRRRCCGAVAAERPRLLLIDIFCRRGTQQQTCRTPLLLLMDGTDRQTDGRTLDHVIDPAPHTVTRDW